MRIKRLAVELAMNELGESEGRSFLGKCHLSDIFRQIGERIGREISIYEQFAVIDEIKALETLVRESERWENAEELQ